MSASGEGVFLPLRRHDCHPTEPHGDGVRHVTRDCTSTTTPPNGITLFADMRSVGSSFRGVKRSTDGKADEAILAVVQGFMAGIAPSQSADGNKNKAGAKEDRGDAEDGDEEGDDLEADSRTQGGAATPVPGGKAKGAEHADARTPPASGSGKDGSTEGRPPGPEGATTNPVPDPSKKAPPAGGPAPGAKPETPPPGKTWWRWDIATGRPLTTPVAFTAKVVQVADRRSARRIDVSPKSKWATLDSELIVTSDGRLTLHHSATLGPAMGSGHGLDHLRGDESAARRHRIGVPEPPTLS